MSSIAKMKKIAKVMTRLYAGKNVEVTIGGKVAFSQGGRINIPFADFTNPKFLTMAHGYIDHEGGHEAETEHCYMGQTKHRYGTLGGNVFNALEDIRMEKVQADKYPGAKINLESLYELNIAESDFPNPAEIDTLIELIFSYILHHGFTKVCGYALTDYASKAKQILTLQEGKEFVDELTKIINKVGRAKDTKRVMKITFELCEFLKSKQEEKDNQSNSDQDSEDNDDSSSSDDDSSDADSDGNDDSSSSDDDSSDADSDGNDDSSSSDDDSSDADSDGNDDSSSSDDDSSDADSDGNDDSSSSDDDSSDADSDGNDDSSSSDDDSSDADSDGNDDSSSSDDDSSDADSDGNDDSSSSDDDSSDADSDGNDDSSSSDDDSNGSSKPQASKLAGGMDKMDTEFDYHQMVADKLSEMASETDEYSEFDEYQIDLRKSLINNLAPVVQDWRQLSAKFTRTLQRVIIDNSESLKMGSNTGRKLLDRRIAEIPAGNKNVFEYKEEHEAPQSSVMVLVDASGSMGSNNMYQANKTALAFAKSFQRMGIDIEVNYFGVCDYSQSKNVLFQAKAFGQRINPERFRVSASGSTPTNDAMFLGISRLLTQPSENKIIIVITDGQPDWDAIAGVRHMNKIAEQAGIKVVPIGLGTKSVDGFKESVFAKTADDVNLALKQAIKKKLF